MTREALWDAASRQQDGLIWEERILPVFTRRQYRPNSLRTYRFALTLLLDYVRHSGVDATFDAKGVLDWLRALGYQQTTAEQRLAQIRILLSQLLGAAPQVISVARSACSDLRSLPYTDREVELLLTHARLEERIIVLLALEAGLTVGDLSSLQRSDVVFEPEALIQLRSPASAASDDVAVTLIKQDQREAGHGIPMSELLRVELRHWLTCTPEQRRSPHLLASGSQAYINARVRGLCQRAGVPCRGLRGLRIAAGAREFRRSGNLRSVAELLRLKTLQQAEAYARAVPLLTVDTEGAT